MGYQKESNGIKILVAVTYLVMVGVNALANILPINGVNTGQVSASYPNLFAPAAITFAIWGVIYVLLGGYTLYHLGLFRTWQDVNKGELLNKIGLLFAVSSLANVAWIFSWHYFKISLSMLWMMVILVCLIIMVRIISQARLSQREKIFIRLPFSIYFGWITVATIANVTTLLVSWNWNGWGITEPVWAIIIIIVGLLIGAATAIKNRDIAYGLVIIWAYAGIYIKHTAASGFAGQYPAVIYTVIGCMVLMLAVLIYVFIAGPKTTHW
jgi:hypothetical protein